MRSLMKAQQRERSIDIGRDLLEREFKRFDLNFSKIVKTADFLKAANDMGHSRADDLVSAVGYGKLSPTNVLHKLYPHDKLKPADQLAAATNGTPSALTQLFRRVAQRTRTSGGVRNRGGAGPPARGRDSV